MYIIIYISAGVLANLLVAKFGPAIMPLNAFLFIGLDLAIRDRLHFNWEGSQLWTRMFALIAGAGVVTAALDPASGRIAVASACAFVAAALASALVFQASKTWPVLRRANTANVAGAAVDSLIFPLIAFGAVFPTIAALQFIAKVSGGALWAWLVFRRVKST